MATVTSEWDESCAEVMVGFPIEVQVMSNEEHIREDNRQTLGRSQPFIRKTIPGQAILTPILNTYFVSPLVAVICVRATIQ
jgi:hypothetical protein